MKKLILRDRNGEDYEVKDPHKFSNHIFNVHGEGSSIHEEEGHYFVVDDISPNTLTMTLLHRSC